MPSLHILCWLVALILFCVAAVGISPQKGSVVAAGLAFLTLGLLLP